MTRISIYSAGSNARGQLSLGSIEDSHPFRPCILPSLDVAQINCIVAGANHTLLLLRLADGTSSLWGCGDGMKGQLGPQYRETYGISHKFQSIDLPQTSEIKYLAASWETSFIVFSYVSGDDVLMSMGANDFGELGIGETNMDTANSMTVDSVHLVNFDHLFPPRGSKWRLRISELRAGPRHVVVRIVRTSDDGQQEVSVVGWGASRHGQLGVHSPNTISYLSTPHLLPLNEVQKLALGNQHTVFLQNSGSVIGLGSNKKNQLCNISVLSDIWLIGATWNGTYLVSKSNNNRWRLYATGSNAHGQLGISSSDVINPQPVEISFPSDITENHIIDMACGSEHVLILVKHRRTSLTEVWGWGWNEHGNLGLGHTIDIIHPKKIWPSADNVDSGRAVGVWAGCGTSWIAVEG